MRALLIHNPAAGRKLVRRGLPEALTLLRGHGWTVDVMQTQGPAHASSLAAHAAPDGYEAVLVAGGDGTINLVVQGLMAAQEAGFAPVTLGLLPAGTSNVLALDLGLPAPALGVELSLPKAAKALLRSQVISIDVGCAISQTGRRFFLCWAGIGLDAAVARIVEGQPHSKQRFGRVYFLTTFVRMLNRPDLFTTYTITADDKTVRALSPLAVVSNIKRYAAIFPMAPQATLDDGLLDVTFWQVSDVPTGLKLIPQLLEGHHIQHPAIRYLRAQRVVIEAASPQDIHLDAEPFGKTPVSIEVVPRALPMFIPQSASARRLLAPES